MLRPPTLSVPARVPRGSSHEDQAGLICTAPQPHAPSGGKAGNAQEEGGSGGRGEETGNELWASGGSIRNMDSGPIWGWTPEPEVWGAKRSDVLLDDPDPLCFCERRLQYPRQRWNVAKSGAQMLAPDPHEGMSAGSSQLLFLE